MELRGLPSDAIILDVRTSSHQATELDKRTTVSVYILDSTINYAVL